MKRIDSCVFCGVVGKLSGEHILPKWLRNIGLSLVPMSHVAGPLNRNVADLGVSPPFNRTINAVCEACNNGWMSDLEAKAKQVLTPAILGVATMFKPDDHAAIGAWVQKTGLIGTLFASRVAGSLGRGVPQNEYRGFFEREDRLRPLPATQVWVGRYQGQGRTASIWVTPMIVDVSGVAEPRSPQAYVITIQLGTLLLQGVRFVASHLFFETSPGHGLAEVWPSLANVEWPGPTVVGDEAFVTTVAKGLHLRSAFHGVCLRPWPEATDLPRGIAREGAVDVLAPCGSHDVTYPEELVSLAAQGTFYWFKLSCPCGTWYLVRTDRGRVRFRDIGSSARIGSAYDALPGPELLLLGEPGPFACKRVPEAVEADDRA